MNRAPGTVFLTGRRVGDGTPGVDVNDETPVVMTGFDSGKD